MLQGLPLILMEAVWCNGVPKSVLSSISSRLSVRFEAAWRVKPQNGIRSEIAIVNVAGRGGLRVSTWNSRALLCVDGKLRSKKLNFLRTIMDKSDIILIQETHGYVELFDTFMTDLATHFLWFHDSWEPGSGGLMFIVRRAFSSDVTIRSIIPGRVAYATVGIPDGFLKVVNIHNYGINSSQMSRVEAELGHITRESITNFGSISTLLFGDMNFLAVGEQRLLIKEARDTRNAHNDAGFMSGRWRKLLENCVELQQGGHTHYDHATSFMSRIDRCYAAIPPWILSNLSWTSTTVTPPQVLHKRGLSDHAPVRFEVQPAVRRKYGKQPIRKEIFEHAAFKGFHDMLFARHIYESMPPFKRLFLHKRVIKEAARMTRNQMMVASGTHGLATLQTLTSIARAVCRNDSKLALSLISASDKVANIIQVDQDGAGSSSVFLVDPVRFAEDVAQSKRNYYNKSIGDIDRLTLASAESSRDFFKRKRASLNDLSKLWSPFGKTIGIEWDPHGYFPRRTRGDCEAPWRSDRGSQDSLEPSFSRTAFR